MKGGRKLHYWVVQTAYGILQFQVLNPVVRPTVLSCENRLYKRISNHKDYIYTCWDHQRSGHVTGDRLTVRMGWMAHKHVAWPSCAGCAWLLLNFFPFPVGHPPCISVGLTSAGLIGGMHFIPSHVCNYLGNFSIDFFCHDRFCQEID